MASTLLATAGRHNLPSLRMLEKVAFVVESRQWTPETTRCVARETVTLVLRPDV